MEIRQTDREGATILEVAGRIDATTAEPFKQHLLQAIGDQPVRLVVDFAGVDFVSSIGLRVLVTAAKRIAVVRGRLLLSGMTGPVRQVFDLAGFASVAPFFADRELALASLK